MFGCTEFKLTIFLVCQAVTELPKKKWAEKPTVSNMETALHKKYFSISSKT